MDYMIQQTSENESVNTYSIVCEDCTAQGITIRVPDSTGSILAVRCSHGMLFCRLFDCSVAERIGLPAAIFAAPTLDDLLKNKPVALSDAAVRAGATMDMTGTELIKLFT